MDSAFRRAVVAAALLHAFWGLGLQAQSSSSPIQDLAAIEPITMTSITLEWSTPYEWDLGYTPAYEGRYSESDPSQTTLDDWWVSAFTLPGLPTSTALMEVKTYEVTGLLPGRTYYFNIKPVDSHGVLGDYSNVVAQATDADPVPPGVPTSVVGSTQVGAAIRLDWVSSGDDGSTGTADHYEVKSSLLPDTSDPEAWWLLADSAPAMPPPPMTSGTDQYMSVGGVLPLQIYTVGIRAFDLAGNPSPIAFAAGVQSGQISNVDVESQSWCGSRADGGPAAAFMVSLAVLLFRRIR